MQCFNNLLSNSILPLRMSLFYIVFSNSILKSRMAGSNDLCYVSILGLRVPGSVQDIYLAASTGRGYFEVGGSTLFYSNLEDGRQMIASSGPFKETIEAVVCRSLKRFVDIVITRALKLLE